ncbi:hypothetical protein HU200_058055 [Digitaria exilis]|uniref:Uncharacterized protein n=1 Tax=Digitaria exilis TaxID=1010633 RepID=A0A835AK03_9POAL|nr:hypothetical protein HU200_058055 [Digitaria exilis]
MYLLLFSSSPFRCVEYKRGGGGARRWPRLDDSAREEVEARAGWRGRDMHDKERDIGGITAPSPRLIGRRPIGLLLHRRRLLPLLRHRGAASSCSSVANALLIASSCSSAAEALLATCSSAVEALLTTCSRSAELEPDSTLVPNLFPTSTSTQQLALGRLGRPRSRVARAREMPDGGGTQKSRGTATVLRLNKGRRSSKLYMFGTCLFVKPGAIVKSSSLCREIKLRIGLDMYKKEYCRLESMGMLRWPAYKEERCDMDRLLQIINRSIHVYKQRRFFYLRSPLFRMPLKKALKKRRQEMKRRRKGTIIPSCRSKDSASHYKINSYYRITTRVLMCTVAPVF